MARIPKLRLDKLLVDRGLVETRSRAQALILAGKVLVDDAPVTKAGTQVRSDVDLRLRGDDHGFVSRGGIKLSGALDDFGLDVAGRVAADLGASTEMLRIQKLKIGYCVGCRKCKQPGYEKLCSINDDMTQVYAKIQDCDAMIIGFPIYTGRESAQLSVFFDRLDCFRRFDASEDRITATRLLKPGRRGMVIGTWGYTNVTTYDHVVEKIATLMNGHRIEPVEALSASGFSGMRQGFDDDGKAMIRRYPEELAKAYAAGRALVAGCEA